MSSEVKIPFGLNEFGSVATVTDPNVQAMQHVKSIVATNPGERVMMSEYGIPLRAYLFEPDPTAVTAKIYTDVLTQMADWEPSVNLLSVEPVVDDVSLGIVDLDVNFSINPSDDSAISTAVVSVGGTVTVGSTNS